MRRNQIRSNQLADESLLSQAVAASSSNNQTTEIITDGPPMNNNQTMSARVAHPQQQHASYTSDDIDSVYLPWMMENSGRKLAIEALKRRGNMCGESSNQTTLLAPKHTMVLSQQQPPTSQLQQQQYYQQTSSARQRTKSPYISQYYAQINDRPLSSCSMRHHSDAWLIDRNIRRRLKRASRQLKPNEQAFDENQSDEVNLICIFLNIKFGVL